MSISLADSGIVTDIYDIAIIGGGINGCGIAREAAGRGASVCLFEMGDLASATSSASTKLIHGGLRYLEYYKFRLVREALKEREVLWKIAPHIVWPLRFVLPYHNALRPAWLLRTGLFIYDHLGARKLLPPTRRVDFQQDATGAPLRKGQFAFGFEYSDCWVDDARMVVLNARDAAARGARIRPKTKVTGLQRASDHWVLTTRSMRSGAQELVKAKVIVNAAGPWVESVLAMQHPTTDQRSARLVKGSHIVVPRLFAHDRCYIFQNADKRIIFAIPYEDDFTLIGTTDQDYHGDPTDIAASADEIDYLCASAQEYFAATITPAQVVWSYAGVRSLFDDGATDAQAATRDYTLKLDAEAGAPLLSVFGGKITTYRRLAEQAIERLGAYLPAPVMAKGRWSGRAPLPGGEFPAQGIEALRTEIRQRHDWLAPPDLIRLTRTYGTRTAMIL